MRQRMNRHQVLTGAVNAGENCYAIGGVDGIPFVAYAAGCNIVILASNFQRVEIIPGVRHDNVQVSCLDCSADFGKIAASYGKKMCIFEPTPLLHKCSPHRLDYKWVQTATLITDCFVRVASWNSEGSQLLTGGECIQIWVLTSKQNDAMQDDVKFQIGKEAEYKTIEIEEPAMWECIWKCRTSNPVNFLKYSPDGTMFASAGKTDRLVKIWYENKKVNFVSQGGQSTNGEASFAFIYIAHPRAITSLSWRKTSKYMPRNSVANMLVTSCRDNICRLWVQTLLPEDGLVNIQQIEALASQAPHLQTQRHRQRIMQRLKHMKSFNQYKKRQATQFVEDPHETIPTLPSTFSVHDFHNFSIQGGAVAPGMHFHLAASINAATDIPLVPNITNSDGSKEQSFVLHWLNNKEVVFSEMTEQLLRVLSQKVLQSETAVTNSDPSDSDYQDQESQRDGSHLQPMPKKGIARDPSYQDHLDDDLSSKHSFSAVSSSLSLAAEAGTLSQIQAPLIDALDRKIDSLLREWHSISDLLFSVHPVDGSFLVWLVDWLDECCPGSFRQAQVSFCSRIPNAFPLGDAATMSESLALYSPQAGLELRLALQGSTAVNGKLDKTYVENILQEASEARKVETADGQVVLPENGVKPFAPVSPTPILCMLSKHSNGTLNLWHLTFGDNSKYTQVLSVSHYSRVCGHRFRINDVTCHPVLPLLLTTSHHNLPKNSQSTTTTPSSPQKANCQPVYAQDSETLGFCSELILWKVDSVGPLSKSGGVTELARINSLETAAFANVAWIPTLLPSTTLGSISNSPSACFVASDGQKLRIYQAVIDARTILAEVNSSSMKNKNFDLSLSSSTSSGMGYRHQSLEESFRIVSNQSTARPGCILELNAISDASHDWQNTQLLHVFQEQMITGKRTKHDDDVEKISLVEPELQAVVDLRSASVFEEPFYLVVLEKTEDGHTSLHMWKILLASHPGEVAENSFSYVPDSNLVQDSDDHSNRSSRSNSPEPTGPGAYQATPLHITTSKVCTQILSLPEEVEIIHAAPAAGHLSSSSIYPACFAPYLICTACSDGVVRLWHCKQTKHENENVEFEWVEWTMMLNNQSSSIDIPGQPLFVSCAYSGRLACAYKYGRSYTKPTSEDASERFVNISVSIFECESTGGSEWILEDTIHLKNVVLPKTNVLEDLDLDSLYDTSLRNKRTVDTILQKLSPNEPVVSEHRPNIQRLLSVPSYTTLHTLRQIIAHQGNQCLLTQKSLVQLDWVSTEDGSHVLTVAVGSKIMLFTPVSTDIAQSNVQALKAYKSVGRPLLKQASSMAPALLHPEEMRWMCLRTTYLSTADGLPPLPMQLSWVRDGILVVGMDSEMHIYSQWRPSQLDADALDRKPETGTKDIRSLKEQELLTRAQETSQLRLPVGGTSSITRNLSCNLISSSAESRKKKDNAATTASAPDSMENLDNLPDFGLFEASRIACPVLPQYHPKQLMELLQFGKISRVKAILSHIVRCLAGMENFKKSYEHFLESTESGEREEGGSRTWSRSRALSIAAASSPNPNSPMDNQGSLSVFPEEIQLDYVEITSIPPLPLFTLLSADEVSNALGRSQGNESSSTEDYTGLFDLGSSSLPDNYADYSSETKSKLEKGMSFSSDKTEITKFGPRQVRLLTQLLTHTHLPGLSSLDQMHLLALADTIASCSISRFETVGSQAKTQHLTADNDSCPLSTVTIDSLDNCGLRYLLAMRHHTYLMLCLPLIQRAQLQRLGLTTNSLVWAFHSETQEELLQLIPAIQKGNPRWSDLRELGIGWWVRNNGTMKHVMEKVAKAAFQAHNNPMDAALYYLAMKKKSLVWGLFRSVRDQKMTAFFQNNFSDDRWRKAALKNAFALLGKQRFEHAAAFFLLAGSLKDAVEVCLHNLDDLQLAMVLVRMYEGDLESTTSSLRRLLYEEILGYDAEGTFYTPSHAHPDPFLRSIALWTLQDYSGSLTTLLQTDVGHAHPKIASDDMKKMNDDLSANPSVFNFYLYLRTHPLVVRSTMFQNVQARKTAKSFLLLGLKHHSPESNPEASISRDDAITPLERRLFFTTAHAHFHAGCPALALEVLCRLPSRIIQPHNSENPTTESSSQYDLQNKGRDDFDWSQPVGDKVQKASHFDWSQPSADEKAVEFDWGQPVISQKSTEHDWSQPISSHKAEDFAWSQSLARESDASSDEDGGIQLKTTSDATGQEVQKTDVTIDVMAQQLKFIACLKIMMEELSTLATGFEVDGGQLRYHLYIWLERSVAALCELCHYGQEATSMGTETNEMLKDRSGTSSHPMGPECSTEGYPTLHEILIADTLDFEAKLQRATRRKKWLKSNETLLRTLLSYCGLHGAHGGGLAAVRMELMLLLQELQQDRSQHQLLSPLPFPTTLPLLAASVACQKTVVTDPIRFLQSMTHDILQTMVVEMNAPPSVLSTSYTQVSILRDLSTALSACIYQSLCDSDNFIVKQSGVGPQAVEDFISSSVVYHNSHLLAGHRSQRNNNDEEPVRATTTPSKWPGVQSLRALLARDKDEDSPKLHTLLCEAFVAVYLSQLIHGLVTYDCHVLYRLVAQTCTEQSWSMLFGGGAKRLLRVSTAVSPVLQPGSENNKQDNGEAGLFNTLSKQRMKLHMKILQQLGQGVQQPTIKEDRPTYREQFIPPDMSLVSCFMSKPLLPNEWLELDYESGESLPSSDEDEEYERQLEAEDDNAFSSIDDRSQKKGTAYFMEELDPSSFSWAIMRLCIVKLSKYYLLSFLDIAGIELQELPVSSPWIHAVLKVLEQWLKYLKDVMDDYGKPPVNYLSNCFVNNAQNGPPILKYKALLEFSNTPFRSHHALAMPAKRLWNYLVRQELVQDVFIRYIFSRKHPHLQNLEDPGDLDLDNTDTVLSNPVRIIHKDQDSITAFCINKASSELMSIATPKEIQELDISLLLGPSLWMEDEAELDILNMQKSAETLASSDYIVVQHPLDKLSTTNCPSSSSGIPPSAGGSTYGSPTGPSPPIIGTQTGRASTMLKKHRCDGVRRMCAHPILPLYLTGSQDGSVKMWEWAHQQPVSEPRPRGTFAKVTKVLFNSQGNKFGVTDGDGNLSLWQVGLTSVTTSPFFSKQCHSKQASDFDFVSSSSLLATAGQSSDGKNVCLWDTLLPSRKAQISAFHCHETGSSALVYAARNQVIISAGKKGDICIFDIRQRQLRQMFQAHEHPIKCLALDPGEEFFVTGSADGDIKVWGLSYHVLLYSFPGEHSRSTLFRNIGMGVSQMFVDSCGRLFSCGADGSLKFRQLPERDLIVKSLI